jgi:hypothetical protein
MKKNEVWKKFYKKWKKEIGENFTTEIERFLVKSNLSGSCIQGFDWWDKKDEEFKKNIINKSGIVFYLYNTKASLPTEGIHHTLNILKQNRVDPEKTAAIWLAASINYFLRNPSPTWSNEVRLKLKEMENMLIIKMIDFKIPLWSNKTESKIKKIYFDADLKEEAKTIEDLIDLVVLYSKRVIEECKIVEFTESCGLDA